MHTHTHKHSPGRLEVVSQGHPPCAAASVASRTLRRRLRRRRSDVVVVDSDARPGPGPRPHSLTRYARVRAAAGVRTRACRVYVIRRVSSHATEDEEGRRTTDDVSLLESGGFCRGDFFFVFFVKLARLLNDQGLAVRCGRHV